MHEPGAGALVVRNGRLVVTAQDGVLRVQRGDLSIVDGKVSSVEPVARIPAGAVVIDASRRVVLPGLVNSHTHSYAQLVRAPVADDWLEPWMVRVAAKWRTHLPSMAAVAAALTAADAVRRGVTALLDHATLAPDDVDPVFSAYEQAGVRAVIAVQVADLPAAEWAPSSDRRLAEAIRRAQPWPAPDPADLLEVVRLAHERGSACQRLGVMVGPAAPERCSPGFLRDLADVAIEYCAGVHTHLLEVPTQRTWGDPVGALADAGLLGSSTTVVHAVLLEEFDRQRLADSGAAVVHVPLSNMFLGCARNFDLPALLRAGVLVSVGTDGVNCGGGQDVLGAARLAVALARQVVEPPEWPAPSLGFQMATEFAGRVLGVPRLGMLCPGAPADFLIVDPVRAGWVGDDVVADAVLCGLGAGLESVWVDGRCLMSGGELLTIDENAVHAEARHATAWLQREGSEDEGRVAASFAPLLAQARRVATSTLECRGRANDIAVNG